VPHRLTDRARLVRGNRSPARATLATLGLGEPPARLSPEALECWREIEAELLAVKVATRLDRWAVELLADALSEYRRLATMRDEKWQPLRLSAFKRTARLLTELGLTPNTRSRLLVPDTLDPGDPFEAFLAQRRPGIEPEPPRRRLRAKTSPVRPPTHTDLAGQNGDTELDHAE
jgi:phage terminase small subunit